MDENKLANFLIKLWNILDDDNLNEIICWDRSGRSFLILDVYSFCELVLPRYFKHKNMASFVRQLNLYGFKKVTTIDRTLPISQEVLMDTMQFAHSMFRRDKPELLTQIKRNYPSSKRQNCDSSNNNMANTLASAAPPQNRTLISTANGSLEGNGLISANGERLAVVPEQDFHAMLDEMNALRINQITMKNNADDLRRDNSLLWNEVLLLRNAYLDQQQNLSRLVQFLLSFKTSAAPKRHFLHAGGGGHVVTQPKSRRAFPFLDGNYLGAAIDPTCISGGNNNDSCGGGENSVHDGSPPSTSLEDSSSSSMALASTSAFAPQHYSTQNWDLLSCINEDILSKAIEYKTLSALSPQPDDDDDGGGDELLPHTRLPSTTSGGGMVAGGGPSKVLSHRRPYFMDGDSFRGGAYGSQTDQYYTTAPIIDADVESPPLTPHPSNPLLNHHRLNQMIGGSDYGRLGRGDLGQLPISIKSELIPYGDESANNEDFHQRHHRLPPTTLMTESQANSFARPKRHQQSFTTINNGGPKANGNFLSSQHQRMSSSQQLLHHRQKQHFLSQQSGRSQLLLQHPSPSFSTNGGSQQRQQMSLALLPQSYGSRIHAKRMRNNNFGDDGSEFIDDSAFAIGGTANVRATDEPLCYSLGSSWAKKSPSPPASNGDGGIVSNNGTHCKEQPFNDVNATTTSANSNTNATMSADEEDDFNAQMNAAVEMIERDSPIFDDFRKSIQGDGLQRKRSAQQELPSSYHHNLSMSNGGDVDELLFSDLNPTEMVDFDIINAAVSSAIDDDGSHDHDARNEFTSMSH